MFVADDATLIGQVSLAAGCSVWFGAVLRADCDAITVGEGSNVQDGCVLHADPGFPIVIGADVSLGHRAIVHGATIEDGVLVGMGSVVLNGAVVGAGSLIAAGAVVKEGMVIPAGSLVAGVPAKVVRELTDEARSGLTFNAQAYRGLAERYRVPQRQ